jgi:hypothetical protein
MARTKKNAKKVSFADKYGFEFNRTEYEECAKELGVFHNGVVCATVVDGEVIAYRDDNRKKVYDLMAKKHNGEAVKSEKPKAKTAKKAEPAKANNGDYRTRLMALVAEYEAMGFGKDVAMQAALAEINAK